MYKIVAKSTKKIETTICYLDNELDAKMTNLIFRQRLNREQLTVEKIVSESIYLTVFKLAFGSECENSLWEGEGYYKLDFEKRTMCLLKNDELQGIDSWSMKEITYCVEKYK